MTIETVKNWTPLNFDLIVNPINWVIVFLMVFIAGLAVSLIFQPSTPTGD